MENTTVVVKEKRVKKAPNPATRATVWKILDVTFAVLPLIVLGIVQRNVYFATANGFSNTIGIGLLGIFAVLILKKKAQILKGFGGFLIVTIILYCLRAILNDLVLISGMATAGMFVSAVWTSRKKIKWERIRDKVETADANANSMAKVVETVINAKPIGRV
jgi:hypothetical protein